MHKINFKRRQTLALSAAAAVVSTLPSLVSAQGKPALLTRAIPRTGEKLGVVGLGTQFVLDVGDDLEKRKGRIGMMQALLDHGGSVIDTAPSYGPAETQLGSMLEEMKARDRVFLSTKFRVSGREGAINETKESLSKLRTHKLEVLLRHNIGFVPKAAADTHLAVAREWKAQGVCRYIGVTHSQDQAKANDRLIEIMRTEKIDFIQVNYSMAERSVEDKLLAAAADTGTALMCNLPYARGALFRAVQGKTVPEWAKDFDAPTWGQFFLKYLLSQPAVNVVIPGTDRVEHMLDNIEAGRTRLPNAAHRKRMVEFIGSV